MICILFGTQSSKCQRNARWSMRYFRLLDQVAYSHRLKRNWKPTYKAMILKEIRKEIDQLQHRARRVVIEEQDQAADQQVVTILMVALTRKIEHSNWQKI